MTIVARWKPLLPYIAIVLAAAMLTLPGALAPVRLNDSFWIDWVWLDQFAEQLRHGTLYPRWLPLSHGGLGSPVFYYYPPLAFYLASIFVIAGLSVWASIVATFLAGYALSGATMYWWLKGQARAPLFGALIFMIAPYHIFNFYTRGALAEFVATALLPLVMLGLRRLGEEKRGGFAIAALSYGALIGTHLPLALLGSLFLFGPYALIANRSRLANLVPIGAALALGAALAAIYLVPSVLLDQYRASALLWQNANLRPSNWNPWNPLLWNSNGYRTVLIMVAAIEIPLLVLIVRHRSGWAAVAAAYGLIAVGAVPILWSLPGLSAVQFPFRLLPVAEFALATAAALVPWGPALLPLAIFPLMWTVIASASPGSEGLSMAELRSLHPDVPENLPPGERPYSWPSRWALGVAASHRQPRFSNGVTVEPLFYFPAWRVTCEGRSVETFADPGTQLLSYRGQGCARKLRMTAPEMAGGAISMLGFLALLAMTAVGRRRRRHA